MFDGLRLHAGDDRPKAYRGGTHRSVNPARTLARLRPSFQRMGITRLNEITGLDCIGLPVTQAVRPLARNLTVNQGKGRTLDEALVSAAVESAETWHAERVVPMMRGTPAEARRRGRIVDPAEVAALSARPGDHDGDIFDWVEGRDALSGDPVPVPLDCVAMDYSVAPDSQIIARSSNGLASGNTWPEALAAGLLELVERDAVARFRALDPMARDARRVRRASLRGGPLEREVAAIAAAGLWLDVWDLSCDSGPPVFEARIFDGIRSGSIYRLPPVRGAGCHLDAGVALGRAVLEAVQSRLTLISGSRDDIAPEQYAVHPGESTARIGSAFFAEPAARPFQPCDLSGDSALQDAQRICGVLVESGLDLVAVVDLTDPAIGLPVLRVVVPGLAVVSGPDSYTKGQCRGDRRVDA